MAAYDFEEVFKEDKKVSGVFAHTPQDTITPEKIKNLGVEEKVNLFNPIEKNTVDSDKNRIIKSFSKLYKGAGIEDKSQSFEDITEEEKQKTLRTSVAGEFLNFIAPDIKGNLSIKMSRVDFKSFMLLPAILAVFASLFISGGALLATTLIFPLFVYLQVSDSAQMKFFETRIWNSIDSIPEEKLKVILHSILSNNLVEDMYDDDEIKEIIYNYMYSSDIEAKLHAKHKIRENLRAVIKSSKNILNYRKLNTKFITN